MWGDHGDTYLEQQETEKIDTEVRDVDRILITEVYACCPGWHSEGVIRALQSVINICYPPPSFSFPLINEDLQAGPQLVFTLNNRFFHHQACYSLLPARPGGQTDRVVDLYKYKVVGGDVVPCSILKPLLIEEKFSPVFMALHPSIHDFRLSLPVMQDKIEYRHVSFGYK